MPNYDFTFKILLLGDASVGKTSFTKRYCYNIFNPSERLTIGVDFHVKTIELNGKKIKLQIWDVGGEERFRFLLPTYCLGANAAFILYDLTRTATLDNIPEWASIVKQKGGSIPIMLVGAKLDLQETQREIQRELGIQIAEKNNMDSFVEISSKENVNVDKAFHYLLINKKIENLKEVSEEYGLTLKRGYKICAVLNDLGLVQIFDRPMKIHISSDLIAIWQVLIHKRIEELQSQFQAKKTKCETDLDEFIKNYSLEEMGTQEPVEFINFDAKQIEELYYPLLTKTSCKIAIGIKYENPIMFLLNDLVKNELDKDLRKLMSSDMRKVMENLTKITVQVIFNNEIVKELLNSNEYDLMNNHLKAMNISLNFKNLEIHVTEEPFSNFSLTNSELIQPSFDHSNQLIGLYISRNKNISDIFNKKFDELFKKGIPINEYIQQDKELAIPPLTDLQRFTLCTL